MHMGEKAIKMAASSLLQIMQDFRNVKRNQKTGARTPHWIVEVIQNLKLDPSTIEASRCEGSGTDPIEVSRGQKPSLRMAGPIEDSRGQPPGEHSGEKRRVLSFQLSTTSDEPQPSQKKVMLALCDEEGNDKYLYGWDEVANRGKRQLPGGRWELCDDVVANEKSAFMECIWHGDRGDDVWTSEMPIVECEILEEPLKKPAAACLKRPASSQNHERSKPDDQEKKRLNREYSKAYHQEKKRAMMVGFTDEQSKKKAQ